MQFCRVNAEFAVTEKKADWEDGYRMTFKVEAVEFVKDNAG